MTSKQWKQYGTQNTTQATENVTCNYDHIHVQAIWIHVYMYIMTILDTFSAGWLRKSFYAWKYMMTNYMYIVTLHN